MKLPPITVPIPPACCPGWFFEHTTGCPTPQNPRPCSDCGAEPGAGDSGHLYSCAWWMTDDTDDDPPLPSPAA